MTILRIDTREYIDNNLLTKLDNYKSASIEDNELKMVDRTGNAQFYDLDDIFLFDYIKFEVEKNRYVAYSTITAASVKPLILFLSKRFPGVVLTNKRDIEANIIKSNNVIQNRLNTEEHFTYIEENHRNGVVNIVSNSDIFMKVDIENNRILSLIDSTLSLFSMDFLDFKNSEEENYLYNMLNALDITIHE